VDAHITCVDASIGMLALAETRLQRAGFTLDRIKFIHSDALAWTPPEQAFDLVVTHFFLDCFPPAQLQQVVEVLARAARPDATWLLADFQLPAAGLHRYRALMIHRMMYLFFRLATRLQARSLTTPDRFLEQHSFSLSERRLSEWDLLHSDRWERACPAKPGFGSVL
jgi:ubiquinone/menaquinone biosynthesis C-methylase UbiE